LKYLRIRSGNSSADPIKHRPQARAVSVPQGA